MTGFPLGRRVTALAGTAALVAGLGVTGAATAAAGQATGGAAIQKSQIAGNEASQRCHLGNGITHVVQLQFDNVHFFRDNPNVPSDLEMMPNLLHFFEGNGTFLSNNHTPLIAHTGNDLLTSFTGLYGDRHGMPVANSYRTYNADGPNGSYDTTDPAGSFAYWTDPVYDTASKPSPAHDTAPNMVYAPSPSATAAHPSPPATTTPAPWVPYTRAGCDVGEVGTANSDLENTAVDIPEVFGPNSPEYQQYLSDTDSFKDAETADYVGIAVHCAQANAVCRDATAVKFGQTASSPSASPDALPDEPGGYQNFSALFGHKYVAPALGAGTPNVTRDGFEVTNADGNLVDENGNQLNGAFLKNYPGFPGYGSINASQALAYMTDMLGSGVPVVNGYISDVHGNEHIPGVSACATAPAALGSGDPCYVAQAQYYNNAFGTFFQRLAAMGITSKNTLFVLSSDEGDHEAGANVGRAVTPVPASCDGATVSGNVVTPDVSCTYPAGTFGELAGNLTGLLATQKNDTTPFTVEADTAPEFYVTGDPGPQSSTVRSLERDVAGLTAANPYTSTTQDITNYIADPVEEGILHMVTADPARTPTFALFAKPDYYLSTGAATCPAAGCVTQNTGFAWDHGDYAAEIDTNYLGLAGPGVKHLGLDGSGAASGPDSAGPDSGQTEVVDSANPGTWADETDIRPTMLALAGLKDDYINDGRVISQVVARPAANLGSTPVAALGACYKQLNSSVGQFGAYTLAADTKAVESNTSGDAAYSQMDAQLRSLEQQRDQLAASIKAALNGAAFVGRPVRDAPGLTRSCEAIIGHARALAG